MSCSSPPLHRTTMPNTRPNSERRCQVCDQTVDPQKSPAMPFCSELCKQIDLARWLGERYGLPYESQHEFDELEEDGEGSKGV